MRSQSYRPSNLLTFSKLEESLEESPHVDVAGKAILEGVGIDKSGRAGSEILFMCVCAGLQSVVGLAEKTEK